MMKTFETVINCTRLHDTHRFSTDEAAQVTASVTAVNYAEDIRGTAPHGDTTLTFLTFTLLTHTLLPHAIKPHSSTLTLL